MNRPSRSLRLLPSVPPLLLALALAAMALAAPVGAGTECSIQATVGGGSATEVPVGEEVLLEGFGFPASSEVEVSYTVGATFLRSETVTADATGAFELTVVPQAGEEGLWSVEAAAVKVCLATTGFMVVAGPEPTAAPTLAPTAAPTAAPTPITSVLPDASMTSDGDASASPWLGLSVGLVALLAVMMLARRPRRLS